MKNLFYIKCIIFLSFKLSILLNMQSVQIWNQVAHLKKLFINVLRSNGSIESDWRLDDSRQDVELLRDPKTDSPLGPGVWCIQFVSNGYLQKRCLISELLELNP